MPDAVAPHPEFADDAATLAPITHERLVATLESMAFDFEEDDGVLTALIEGGHPCWFSITGPNDEEIALNIQARWRPSLDVSNLAQAFQTVNDWNGTQIFPRAITVPDENDNCVFVADFTQDFDRGVTDLQLENAIAVALTTTMNFLEYLNAQFPDALDDDYGFAGDEQPSAQ